MVQVESYYLEQRIWACRERRSGSCQKEADCFDPIFSFTLRTVQQGPPRHGGRLVHVPENRGPEKQCPEIWGLAENASGCVDSKELGCKRRPCEIAVQAVLNAPRRTFVSKIEMESAPRMTDEVVDGTEAIERPSELAVQQRMKALAGDGGGRDF